MTILEAIKEAIGYQISTNRANMTLIKRGLTGTGEATQAVLTSREFELATADLIYWMITTPNISEGGYHLTITDKKTLQQIASGIFSKWGVSDPSTPTARFVSPW